MENEIKECWICLDDEGELKPSRCDCTGRWHHLDPCYAEWIKRSGTCPVCLAPYPVSQVTLSHGEMACRLAAAAGMVTMGCLVSFFMGTMVNMALAVRLTDKTDLIPESVWWNALLSLLLGHMLSIPLVWLGFWCCLYRPKLIRRSYHETDYWWYIFGWILMGPYFVPFIDMLLAPAR